MYVCDVHSICPALIYHTGIEGVPHGTGGWGSAFIHLGLVLSSLTFALLEEKGKDALHQREVWILSGSGSYRARSVCCDTRTILEIHLLKKRNMVYSIREIQLHNLRGKRRRDRALHYRELWILSDSSLYQTHSVCYNICIIYLYLSSYLYLYLYAYCNCIRIYICIFILFASVLVLDSDSYETHSVCY